jgi:hypothetical protein
VLHAEEPFELRVLFMDIVKLEFETFTLNGLQSVSYRMKIEEEGRKKEGGSEAKFCFKLDNVSDVIVKIKGAFFSGFQVFFGEPITSGTDVLNWFVNRICVMGEDNFQSLHHLI